MTRLLEIIEATERITGKNLGTDAVIGEILKEFNKDGIRCRSQRKGVIAHGVSYEWDNCYPLNDFVDAVSRLLDNEGAEKLSNYRIDNPGLTVFMKNSDEN